VTKERNIIGNNNDHLGSAAYLTDDGGQVTQTLNYLPYGEDWVDIQNNLDPRLGQYTFNGKAPRKGNRTPINQDKYSEEGDWESGFHYYGARYYWSEVLTGWLSVDPMADKYPSLSPYNYCVGNPVKLVDPDGNEVFEDVDWPPSKLANAKNEWRNCCSQEKTFVSNNPYKAYKMYSNQETAVTMSRGKYPDTDGRGTKRDAYRHAMWQALNVQSVGEEATREMANAHEYRDGQTLNDLIMDIHNNEVGIEIGRNNPNASPDELSQIIQNRISNGDMIVISDDNKKMTKSNGESINRKDIRGVATVTKIISEKKNGNNEKKQNY
jgi:RHS repeat-associated protein